MLCALLDDHAGIVAEPVTRPLVGVALGLPPHADPLLTARALDAEQVTAGFVDFAQRACVALPADPAHLAQVAHSVAKVVHLLWEVHTPFIDQHSDTCPLPDRIGGDAETCAAAVVAATHTLICAWDDWQHLSDRPAALTALVAEGLDTLQTFVYARAHPFAEPVRSAPEESPVCGPV